MRLRLVPTTFYLGLLVLAGLPAAAGIQSVPNQAPSFIPGPDIEAQEDDVLLTFLNWATAIRSGPETEPAQPVRFEVTNKDSTLFAVQPSIDAAGTLTFQPAQGAFGITTVTVLAYDDGGTDEGGEDTSEAIDFLITLHQVNDAPVFEIQSGSVVIGPYAGAVTLANWACHIGPGSQFEVGQAFAFIVTNNSPALFSAQPAIGPDGTLTFTPGAGVHGVAQVTAVLHDSGGTHHGGDDTSSPVTFSIIILPTNQPPTAIITVSQTVWRTSTATNIVVVSPNNRDATTALDGSHSLDTEGNPLDFLWFIADDSQPLTSGAHAFATIEVGQRTVTLLVNDGHSDGAGAVHLEVIAAADAVGDIVSMVQVIAMNRHVSRTLQTALRRAERAFERGDFRHGLAHLRHFEREVRLLVAPRHRAAASELIHASRLLARALIACGHPSPR